MPEPAENAEQAEVVVEESTPQPQPKPEPETPPEDDGVSIPVEDFGDQFIPGEDPNEPKPEAEPEKEEKPAEPVEAEAEPEEKKEADEPEAKEEPEPDAIPLDDDTELIVTPAEKKDEEEPEKPVEPEPTPKATDLPQPVREAVVFAEHMNDFLSTAENRASYLKWRKAKGIPIPPEYQAELAAIEGGAPAPATQQQPAQQQTLSDDEVFAKARGLREVGKDGEADKLIMSHFQSKVDGRIGNVEKRLDEEAANRRRAEEEALDRQAADKERENWLELASFLPKLIQPDPNNRNIHVKFLDAEFEDKFIRNARNAIAADLKDVAVGTLVSMGRVRKRSKAKAASVRPDVSRGAAPIKSPSKPREDEHAIQIEEADDGMLHAI
jgi:hypothetical protein